LSSLPGLAAYREGVPVVSLRVALAAAWFILGAGSSYTPVAAQDAEAVGRPLAPERTAAVLGGQSGGFQYEIYQVRPGDTVENIAARFGLSAQQIRRVNRLSSSARAQPGQSLALVLPHRTMASPAAPSTTANRRLEPRYAHVLVATPITREPSAPGSPDVLYEPAANTRLVVGAEQGDHWGVIMIDGSTGWIPKSAVQMTDEPVPPGELEILLKGGRPDIVQEAFRYLGTPYRYGGHLPLSVDCSLLVRTAFTARGISLPRTAAAQYEHGQPVTFAELLPGDRLYFVDRSGRINHTGIYIGSGKFIHASARRGRVAVDNLLERQYWARFLGARRS
jgi:LysM repeat protein